LGSGTDGWVFSLEPHSVLKVHKTEARFRNELNVYQRLAEHQVNRVGALHVPELENYDAKRLIIEISYVTPPYLIDFGKSHLDHPPTFDDEARQLWQQEIAYRFGSRCGDALQIYHVTVHSFSSFGGP